MLASPSFLVTPQSTVSLARTSAQTLADAHDVFPVEGNLKPYRNDKEFQTDLQRVLEEDYGVTLMGVQLEEAASNVKQFLRTFL